MRKRKLLWALLAGLLLTLCAALPLANPRLRETLFEGAAGRSLPYFSREPALRAWAREEAARRAPGLVTVPEPATRPQSFSGAGDYVQAWQYLLSTPRLSDSFETEEILTKEALSARLEEIKGAFYPAMWTQMEQASFFNEWEVQVRYWQDGAGLCHKPVYTLTLLPGYGLSGEEAKARIVSFQDSCRDIVTSLFADGTLREEMAEKERAWALYVYLAHRLRYDETGTRFTGYDALVHETAVCQGYTAMYNCLCKFAGLNMGAMTGNAKGSGHVWSRIFSEGAWYNIDCTWGDPVPDRPGYCDGTWFWQTDEWMKSGDSPRSFDADSLTQAGEPKGAKTMRTD